MDIQDLVLDRLIELAYAGKTISYNELAAIVGLDVEKAEDRRVLVRILAEIGYSENAAGRPLITAVVVRPEIRYPGTGFFIQARELGFNTFEDDRSYYEYELKKVYAFWSLQTPVTTSVPYMVVRGVEVHVAAGS